MVPRGLRFVVITGGLIPQDTRIAERSGVLIVSGFELVRFALVDIVLV